MHVGALYNNITNNLIFKTGLNELTSRNLDSPQITYIKVCSLGKLQLQVQQILVFFLGGGSADHIASISLPLLPFSSC